jgi:hypothetical protein
MPSATMPKMTALPSPLELVASFQETYDHIISALAEAAAV